MKDIIRNRAPKASLRLYNRAILAGIDADILERSKPRVRHHSSLGSSAAPQKVIILNGIRMSIGQAEQYIAKRENNP